MNETDKANCITYQIADLEQPIGDGANEAHENKEIHPRFSVRILSKRKRLADIDGISVKAAIDGLVAAGILPDDSPKYLKEIRHCQEKSDKDETIIEVYEVE